MSTADFDLYAAAVGPRTGFYLPYFQRAEQRGYQPVSWNWATFFFGVFWFLYRRQYRWAAGLALAALLIGILAGQVAIAGLPGLATFLQVALLIAIHGVFAPLKANGFYHQWVAERVAQAKTAHAYDREQQLAFLAKRGGTNLPAALVVFGVILFVALAPGAGPGPS